MTETRGVFAEGEFEGIERIKGWCAGSDFDASEYANLEITFRMTNATLGGTTGPLIGRKCRIVVEEI